MHYPYPNPNPIPNPNLNPNPNHKTVRCIGYSGVLQSHSFQLTMFLDQFFVYLWRVWIITEKANEMLLRFGRVVRCHLTAIQDVYLWKAKK